MDINLISLSSIAAQCETGAELSVAVLDMSLDDFTALSDSMKQMMELSVNPGLGANVDISI